MIQKVGLLALARAPASVGRRLPTCIRCVSVGEKCDATLSRSIKWFYILTVSALQAMPLHYNFVLFAVKARH
jgi:hypothetical protein